MSTAEDSDTGRKLAASLQKRAEDGDMDAAVALGELYEEGTQVKRDLNTAALWYKRAAQKNNPRGLYHFGIFLSEGIGVARDRTRAFGMFMQGANQGDPDCQSHLGYCYQHGEGTEVDLDMALQWYKTAAAKGQAKAQHLLGIMYEDGLGVDCDFEQARLWYQKSVANGEIDAAYSLGLHYHTRLPEPDELEAIYWYRKSAEDGNSAAQRVVGELLFLSEQVAVDLDEAVSWLRKSAVAGDKSAYGGLIAVLIRLGEEQELAYWTCRALPESLWTAASLGSHYADRGNKHAAVIFLDAVARDDEYAQEDLRILAADGYTIEAARDYFIKKGVDINACLQGACFLPFDEGGYPIPAGELEIPLAVQVELDCLAKNAVNTLPANSGLDSDHMQESDTTAVNKARSQETSFEDGGPHVDNSYQDALSADRIQYEAMLFMHSNLPPGSILENKYLNESILGKGGMSIVFKARHLLMDRVVAIKMLLPELLSDPKTTRRFIREGKAASALRHPNVITIYDTGITTEKTPYIVMDCITGPSLDDLLEKERVIEPDRAVRILLQVCDALTAAHSAKIVHRDIKPSNIMLENTPFQSESVRLVDFGIAKVIGGNQDEQKVTKTGEVFGSLVYMSPEQCMGKPLDGRSDIYSLGCVLFEMLTGELPFIGTTVFETMTNHITGEAPDLHSLISHLKGARIFDFVYKKAVAKNPEDRYQTAEALRLDLASVLD